MQKKEKALQLQKRREKTKETSKEEMSKKKGGPVKGKYKAEIETMDANRCPICDMNWEDDDGKNGQWLGCECGQWLHEDCVSSTI